MTSDPDFEQAATVFWIREEPQGKDRREFASLLDAIRFAMDLPEGVRFTAYIQTDAKHYSIEEIERLHQELNAKSSPTDARRRPKR